MTKRSLGTLEIGTDGRLRPRVAPAIRTASAAAATSKSTTTSFVEGDTTTADWEYGLPRDVWELIIGDYLPARVCLKLVSKRFHSLCVFKTRALHVFSGVIPAGTRLRCRRLSQPIPLEYFDTPFALRTTHSDHTSELMSRFFDARPNVVELRIHCFCTFHAMLRDLFLLRRQAADTRPIDVVCATLYNETDFGSFCVALGSRHGTRRIELNASSTAYLRMLDYACAVSSIALQAHVVGKLRVAYSDKGAIGYPNATCRPLRTVYQLVHIVFPNIATLSTNLTYNNQMLESTRAFTDFRHLRRLEVDDITVRDLGTQDEMGALTCVTSMRINKAMRYTQLPWRIHFPALEELQVCIAAWSDAVNYPSGDIGEAYQCFSEYRLCPEKIVVPLRLELKISHYTEGIAREMFEQLCTAALVQDIKHKVDISVCVYEETLGVLRSNAFSVHFTNMDELHAVREFMDYQ